MITSCSPYIVPSQNMFKDPILQAFRTLCRRSPQGPLVVSARHQFSVSQVDDLARAAGALLAEADLAAGALVGLAAPNGPGFLAGLVAIRQAQSPALLYDWRSPESAKLHIANTLGAAATLVCHRPWPRGKDDFSVVGVQAVRSLPSPSPVLEPDIAVVKLTSGSTGNPRGILTPSHALVADDAALASTMGLEADERILAAIPMSHSYGLASVAMPALMRGSVLVVPDSSRPLDAIHATGSLAATFLPTVPAYLQALVKMSNPPKMSSALRLVVTAGAPLKPATARRFREIYGLPVHVFYGSSESGGITFDRSGKAGEEGSVGTPVDGVQVTLEPVAGERTEVGSVTVRSPAVARSYFPQADPGLAHGCFRTSDLAVLRHGKFFLEGRLDQLINVRGKKVNPKEVDAVLGQLEGAEEVVTLGVVPPGQEEKIVRSFVACRPGQLSYKTVHEWCRRNLAEYKVPRSIILVDEIPRTRRGKLDRAALVRLQGPARHE